MVREGPMEKDKFITYTDQDEIDFCVDCPHKNAKCGYEGCAEFKTFKANLVAKKKEIRSRRKKEGG
jgi:hypothetical protein